MRNISFALTTDQIRHGFETGEILKDITSRLGWLNAKPGERLRACVKCMGRKAGEPLQVLGIIEILSVQRVRLDAITPEIVVREGFPGKSPEWFVAFFIAGHRRHPKTKEPTTGATIVTRIEFRYVR